MLSGDRSIGQGRQGPFHHTLAGLRRYWRRIDVICPRAPDASPRQPFDNVFVHPSPQGRAVQPSFIVRRGRALLAERRYDLVVTHDFGLFYNGIGARMLLSSLAASRRPPLVSEIHHLPGVPRASGSGERASLLLHHLYVTLAWPRLAAVRVVNYTVAAYLRRWGVPVDRIRVLSSFYLDHTIFRPYDVPKELDVVFCARLVPNKAPLLLLDALAVASRARPGLRCAIVGEGPLQRSMERRAADLGLRQNVSFLGWLPSATDVAALYARSRLLACTSFNEGGPRVTLEAMACGTPVVSTPVGIMPDVICHGESGLLSDWSPEDVGADIFRLLTDGDAAMRMGAAGHQAVQRFNYDDELRRYVEAYLEIAHAGAAT